LKSSQQFVLKISPSLFEIHFKIFSSTSISSKYYFLQVGWDSVVAKATRYGLEGPGIESQYGKIFRTYPELP
jgi:hypothetical protein